MRFILIKFDIRASSKSLSWYAKLGPTACGSRLEGGAPSDYGEAGDAWFTGPAKTSCSRPIVGKLLKFVVPPLGRKAWAKNFLEVLRSQLIEITTSHIARFTAGGISIALPREISTKREGATDGNDRRNF